MNVKLTSHFAGNKVTLFDFQLAENMNKQMQITQKWFSPYPWVTSSQWTTFKIFIVTFVLVNFAFQMVTHWGVLYPSASQRGEKPQAGHYRPIMVNSFEFNTGGIRGEKQVELYAKANVDDYAFKTNLFSSKKVI